MIIIKRPNGAGGVRKLSGRRRKPWQAIVSAGYEIRNNKVCVKQVSLGTFETRREALEALGVWQAEHLRADMMHLTVRDIYKRLEGTWTDAVHAHMRAALEKFDIIADKRLVTIKTHTIESVPLPPLSYAYHKTLRSFWHAIFMYGIENDIVTKDYSQFVKFSGAKEKVKKTIFTPDEIKILVEDRLFRILLYTGMRINELLSMRTDQVYEEDGILCFHISEAKTEAGKRIIPVHSAIINDVITENERVVPIAYNTASRALESVLREHRMTKHTLHDFRRTFASYAKSCGVDEYYRKCLMGHAHDNITDAVYTQAFVSDLKKQIEMVCYNV